jgi:hypothetical protein
MVVGDHVLGLRTGVEAKRAVRESFSPSRRAGQEMMDVSQARVVEMCIYGLRENSAKPHIGKVKVRAALH